MKASIHTSASIKAVALGGLAYALAWIVAVVVALAAWTQFHAILRYLGPDTMVFFGTVAATGVIVFAIVAGALKRLTGFYPGLPQHFRRTWALYGLTIWMLVMRIAYWPSDSQSFEGGNIMTFVALFLAMLGIGLDWAISRIQTGRGQSAMGAS